jgi:pimeloyl-ACP methyl ester carboxylesterase
MRFQNQGKSRKDTEMQYFGLTRQVNAQTGESYLDKHQRENEIAKWEGESGCIDRRSWSLFFQDERDYVISMLYPIKHHQMGGVIINDFNLFKEQKPALRIPTLVITGKSSLYNSIEDSKAIAKYYRGICLVYPRSSCMPFCEESKRFNKDVAGFLRKFTRVKKAKSKK